MWLWVGGWTSPAEKGGVMEHIPAAEWLCLSNTAEQNSCCLFWEQW